MASASLPRASTRSLASWDPSAAAASQKKQPEGLGPLMNSLRQGAPRCCLLSIVRGVSRILLRQLHKAVYTLGMAWASAALDPKSSLNLTLDPRMWGRGAAGSAIAWAGRGGDFESRGLHHSSTDMAS